MARNIIRASGVTWMGSSRDWTRCKNRDSPDMGLFCWDSEAWQPEPRKVARRWHTCFSETMMG